MSYAGKNLRYLRKLRGWTQEEFANKLKIKRSLIGAYEEERAEPRLDVLENLCNIFKLSLDELLLKDLTESKGNSYLEKRRQLKMSGNTGYSVCTGKSCRRLSCRLCRSGIYRRVEYIYIAYVGLW